MRITRAAFIGKPPFLHDWKLSVIRVPRIAISAGIWEFLQRP
jgi:hypothetical protein